MKFIPTTVIALLVFLNPIISAQPNEQEHLKDKLSLEILVQSGGKKSAEQMFNRILVGAPPAVRQHLLDRFEIDELMVQLASVYTKRFSVKELEDILEHYQTPIGKSFAKKRPAMMALSMKAGQDYMQKKMAGLQVDLPKHGPKKDDSLKIAIALTEASGETAATAETIDLMLDSLKKTNPPLAKRMGELIIAADMNLLGAKAMADTFTAKEMQAMIDFFRTPTGQKLAKHTPAIMRESGQASEKYFQSKLRP